MCLLKVDRFVLALVFASFYCSISSGNHCPATNSKFRFLRLIGLNAQSSQCPLRKSLNLKHQSGEESDESRSWYVCTPGWTRKFGSRQSDFRPIVHIVNASLFFSSGQNTNKEETAENEESAETGTSPLNGSSIKNASNLHEELPKTRTDSWCMLVNFFAPNCPFSTKLAPAYNALARAFPDMFVAAVDATQNVKLNLVYGISGTPSVLLFQNGRPVARYDQSGYDLPNLMNFVTRQTDLTPVYGVKILDEDYYGPLSSEMPDKRDVYLLICVYFLILCSCYHFATSSFMKSIVDLIRRNWREMNEE